MTPLASILATQIARAGPMTLAEYMSQCLLHPVHGYYTTRDPLGASGDFTTAPEISQMFGELIGLCIAQSWLNAGAPTTFVLAELGPGRGTLMKDILRATRSVPGFHAGADLHLVEASPKLQTAQAKTLAPTTPVWHDTVDTLPDAPLFLVANEFLDALPIRQFLRHRDGWQEKCVGTSNGVLSFGLSDPAPVGHLAYRLEDTKDGDLVELCPQLPSVIEAISSRIAAHGGTALFIDYGDWRSLGDTLQALQGHKKTDPLANPGHADLTVHVDFETVARSATCAHTRLTPQGVFLERLGITARAQALAKGLAGEALNSHIAAHRRLTHPGEMGTLFKVLGLYQSGQRPPPGLET